MAPTTYTDVLARNIRAARSRQGLSQADVVERMRNLGFTSWHRPTLGNVERGERAVRADEILGLAFCLETTVQRLMTPLGEDKWVELPSGEALRVGAVVSAVGGLTAGLAGANDGEIHWYRNKPVRTVVPPHELEGVRWSGPAAPLRPEPQTVVAAIVTSDRGVLVTRRVDQNPPWGFTAGWGEPGESPEDTMIREVKEEADLRIQVGEYLGERDHPATGRHMIYYGARPTHGTEIHLGDKGELTEVRWASLAEADELMPDMFGPVREYLARELGES
jgi:8-oxo-dGTP diphosphatase